ncbi:DUF221-domain-containing protein [Eremomyces bilateralis CBS 781.70]|uniref:DUF221-domain-containing protein n=1 Tax=Eremomyces bilateralis CBS 781.70 TaxID=1392243 RepID=A0A6G1G4U7_9PEZI|nr:DUF221-domain-containing protein [Eremomyces bilateralis CBS 781.70]KAF1813022.1 DUF221-domain-containing protein [Eremomyces bilateralis CBS 781.70]
MDPSISQKLSPRQNPNTATDEFLDLLSDPFSTQIQNEAIGAALVVGLGATALVAVLFSFLRRFNKVIYQPKVKHADARHAPPPIGNGPFAWITPVVRTKEQIMVEKAGVDAALFLRFAAMLRNMFAVLTVIGCGILIPINILGGHQLTKEFSISAFMKMTPQYMFGEKFWGHVAVAYLFDVTVCFFLWWNYRAVVELRRNYFESDDYQRSLHARTLMVTDIPSDQRSDEGLLRITDTINHTGEIPRAAIARNVKELPEMIEEHAHLVRQLEGHLAKYLKNPDHLALNRPTCKPSKKDKAHSGNAKVDAIEYLTGRIQDLEGMIKSVRETVDKRNAMPFGFASYGSISEAHSIAYAARKKHPQGTTIRLAPRPGDLIWKNLPLSKSSRRRQRIMNNVWVVLLTLVWIAPNALIAIFLSNLNNLGRLWPAFAQELQHNPKTWAIVQGVLAPAVTSLFYLVLPIIFRRLSIKAGDQSKSQRERHVLHKLYTFFVFNNLIVFSLFSTVWKFVTIIIDAKHDDKDVMQTLSDAKLLNKLLIGLCELTVFWVCWLLQRNLAAAIDLSQFVNLAWKGFTRKVTHPTPRELIELTAPPPFDYATYYNSFLFYATVALFFAPLQPVVLAVMLFYFSLDSWLKKYLLLYVFITKSESGGAFWRVVFNRMLVAILLSNIVVALAIAANGYSTPMLISLIPLPFLLAGFKFYCVRAFDTQTHYYATHALKDPEIHEHSDSSSVRDKRERVSVRYGHPALYKPLITPMVHEKSRHLLTQVYQGRTSADLTDTHTLAGYSDTYAMHPFSKPGDMKMNDSAATGKNRFEFVSEGDIAADMYAEHPDFKSDFQGDLDSVYTGSRPGTPATLVGDPRHGRSASQDRDDDAPGIVYPHGYHQTPRARPREFSPAGHAREGSLGRHSVVVDGYGDESRVDLAGAGAPMGRTVTGQTDGSYSGGAASGHGYRGLPVDTPGSESDGMGSEGYFQGRGMR